MGSEGRHTPGPWKANRERFIKADNGFVVAQVRGPTGRGKEYYEGLPFCDANARLIAAAPDLLSALDALMAIETADIGMDEFGDDESVGAYQDPKSGEVKDLPLTFGHLRRARAAIAKATGAQPPSQGSSS